MNPQDRRQSCKPAFEGSETFSLSPAEGERAGVRGKNRVPIDQVHVKHFDAIPHPFPTAVELMDNTADKVQGSPSPPAAGGEGRGEEGHFCSTFPSPQPSPRSFLAGRGRSITLAASLNSTAAHPIPLPYPRGEGIRHRSVVHPADPSVCDSTRSTRHE
jgi:hypothetical protein